MAKKFSFWTGPTIVNRVADHLTKVGFHNVYAGTEKVYFQMSPLVEHAAGDKLLYKAQELVEGVYPHAGFNVQEV